MPAGFELIDPAVKGQQLPAALLQNPNSCWQWSGSVSYKQFLKDRVRIFVDNWGSTKHPVEAHYIARVVKSGHMAAPAAKAELMYKPQIHGLSIPQRFRIKNTPNTK